MSSEESEPHDLKQDAVSASEDDWGDAMQESGNGEWGEAPLPARRADSERRRVNVVEAEEKSVEQVEEAAVPPEGSTYVTHHGTVKVREITGSRPRRLKPQKPSIDKMPRKEGAFEKAKNERWDVEDKEWSSATTFRTRWVVVIAAIGLAVIPTCLYLLSRMNPAPGGGGLPDEGSALLIREAVDVADDDMEDLIDHRIEAQQLYAAFATADDVDGILPLLRNAGELEPLVRKVGHRASAPKGWQLEKRSMWSLHFKNKKPYARLWGELPDFKHFDAYFVLEQGVLRIDWKATTGYCTAPYEQLLNGEGDSSEVRGTIVPAELYTTAYPEGQYQCYKLESPDGLNLLWCYTRLETRTAEEIARLFIGGGIADQVPGPTPVTLKLTRRGEGGLGNQWLIEELLHEQWIEM